MNSVYAQSFFDELEKISADLTAQARSQIKEKSFAIPEKRKYPIHDEKHARLALAFVQMHGSPEEKSRVHAAVAKKYPGIASHSSIEDVREKAAAEGPMLKRLQHYLAEGAGTHHAELAGLGVLAALPADTLQAKMRSKPGEDWEHKSLLGGEVGHSIGDIAGLGMLAGPSIAHLVHK